jgi:hypothetical protein
MSVSLDEIPQVARTAWTRLRDELRKILGNDLVALWAHGGTTFPDRPRRSGDLDTYAVLDHLPGESTWRSIDEAHALIAREAGVDWDAWYVLADDARRREIPRHAFREGRCDTSWAIHRAHWHAGQYVHLDGREPDKIVAVPTWAEIEVDLRGELDHLERHVAQGDDDPFEATYAIFNGSRILHAVETGNVVLSKRSAGAWALERLPRGWQAAIHAAGRAYDGEATPEDAEVLRTAMVPFVAMVRTRLPALEARTDRQWSTR